MTQAAALKRIMFPSDAAQGELTASYGLKYELAAPGDSETEKNAKANFNATYWVGRVLAGWVRQARQGPKRMHHVSFQGLAEVSRQMGMEMSRQ